MKTDLVLAPFGASAGELLAAARAADAGGFDAVWTYDHFSGLVQGAPWSRDPFVTLAAIAATTERVNVGVLVANVANRHPAQLACAVNTLQSLAPGRVLLGVGAGTAASSAWSAEATAIGRPVPPAATCRAVLAETIDALRAIWVGAPWAGEHVQVAAAMAVTDGAPAPPIVVGAGSRATIRVACEHADGVNVLPGADLAERVAFARQHAIATPFEVSAFVALDVTHSLGGEPAELATLGVERRTLYVSAPYPLGAIADIGARLRPVEPGERLTTDHDEIDHRAVWQWLHDESYWARGRPWALQQRALAASRCFAVVGPDGDTRACCRVVTDGATFAWLADVVVLPPFRGRGLGKQLVDAVVKFQQDVGIRRVVLSTDTAHGLYAPFGFSPVDAGFMDRVVAYNEL